MVWGWKQASALAQALAYSRDSTAHHRSRRKHTQRRRQGTQKLPPYTSTRPLGRGRDVIGWAIIRGAVTSWIVVARNYVAPE